MPVPVFQFNAVNYTPFLYPPPGYGAGGDRARINIYGSNGNKVYLIFNNTLKPNSWDAATKTGVAYATEQEFDRYVDLLRNENPIMVTVNPNAPVTYVIYAPTEPLGEGERP